jgi:hypothetical protein
MTDAERQRRHRGRTKLCKYCSQPGQRLNGLGYASENEELMFASVASSKR